MRLFEHVSIIEITRPDVIRWRGDLLAIMSAVTANMPTAFEADYGRVRVRMPYAAPVASLHAV